jgi:hypothetical protein
MNSQWRWLTVLMLIAALAILGGCGSKINKENYDKIEIGMTYDEVVSILGAPVQSKSILGTKSCDWGDQSRSVNIKFLADKVVFRSAEGLD